MKVLVVLTYYRPHTSGLTIYAERLAKAMSEGGHQVTILTSQFDRQLPREEKLEECGSFGHRCYSASAGVIMPTFGWLATKLVTFA